MPGWGYPEATGWRGEGQPCHSHAERPHGSKKPFSSCLASGVDALAQLVATGDSPRAKPRLGKQQGQEQDKPIPGAELLATAGGRWRGIVSSEL